MRGGQKYQESRGEEKEKEIGRPKQKEMEAHSSADGRGETGCSHSVFLICTEFLCIGYISIHLEKKKKVGGALGLLPVSGVQSSLHIRWMRHFAYACFLPPTRDVPSYRQCGVQPQ